jgi:hypothetical protein
VHCNEDLLVAASVIPHGSMSLGSQQDAGFALEQCEIREHQPSHYAFISTLVLISFLFEPSFNGCQELSVAFISFGEIEWELSHICSRVPLIPGIRYLHIVSARALTPMKQSTGETVELFSIAHWMIRELALLHLDKNWSSRT